MNILSTLFITSLAFTLSLALCVKVTVANSREEPVISPHGGIPYLIVRKDERGQSKREPGFYVRAEEGSRAHEEWELIVAGDILVKPVTGGVSSHLSMGRQTSRYDVLVVANGRLALMNIFGKTEGLQYLGEGSFEVIHPLTHEAVRLPLISSHADLSLHEEELHLTSTQKAQLLLVSIKNESSITGDGVTFAILMDPSQNESTVSRGFRPTYRPILLNDRFYKPSELKKLIQVVEEEPRLFSGLLIKHFGLPANTDSKVMKEWRDLLGAFRQGELSLSDIESTLQVAHKKRATPQFEPRSHSDLDSDKKKLTLSGINSLPWIDIYEGEWEVPELPFEAVSLLEQKMVAIHDPIAGRSGLYDVSFGINFRDIIHFQPIIHGVVVAHDERLMGGTQGSAAAQQVSLVHLQDGRIFLMAKHPQRRGQFRTVELSRPNNEHRHDETLEFAWFFDSETETLLASWKFAEGNLTAAYKLDLGKNQLVVESEFAISRRFYSFEQLKRRSFKREKKLIFDDQTQHSRSEGEYKDLHSLTAVHVAVSETLKRGILHFIFPEPLTEVRIDDSLFYREFEKHAEVDARSGLYFSKKLSTNQTIEQFIRGESPQMGEFRSVVIAEHLLETELGKIQVKVIPLDISFHGGLSTQIFVTMLPDSGNFAPGSEAILPNPIDMRRLTLLGFIDPVLPSADTMKRGRGRNIKRLIMYMTLKESKNEPSQTIIFQMDYHPSHGKPFRIQNVKELRVERQELSESEIVARILVDDQNNAYWVHTPERDRTDEKYQVIRVDGAETIRPRRRQDIRLQNPNATDDNREHLKVDRDSWKILDSLNLASEAEIQERKRLMMAPEYQTDVFPQLKSLVNDLAHPEKAARHVALIVPDDLMEYAKQYIWALRYREQKRLEHWNSSNPNHIVFSLKNREELDEIDQFEVLSNLAKMRDIAARRRAMFLSSFSDILEVARPRPRSDTHSSDIIFLEEEQVSAVGNPLTEFSRNRSESTRHLPHLLYLLAVEGQRVAIQDFQSEVQNRMSSQILFGTKSEWEKLQVEAEFESGYGLFDHFEIVELEPPTRDVRVEFAIRNVLNLPAVRLLRYQPSLEGMVNEAQSANFTREEAEQKLMTYLVNRSEQLAIDNQMPVFESFMRVLNELARQLTQNLEYRRARVIDRTLIEKVLIRIFPMPLNLNVLPETDPLRVLSRDDADFLWLKAGYPGSLEFKMRVIKTILSQLNTDDVRTMKSSAIITGRTGSTKTRAITTLFDMLNLRRYDFEKSEKDNDGSWAFVLNMSRIIGKGSSVEKSEEGQRMMGFEEAKKHFDQFLASEHGSRGFIFLDDIHLAPGDVRAYFLRRIRSLQDEKTYRTIHGDERPTRNITLFLAMNPIEKIEIIRKHARRENAPTEAEIILATLSSEDYLLDQSFLARWGDIIPLSYFPSSSKGPAALDVLEPARRNSFSNFQRLVFISPEVIDATVASSPATDARTFLSTVTSRLMSLPKGESSRVYMIVPKRLGEAAHSHDRDPVSDEIQYNMLDAVNSLDEAAAIEQFIEDQFQAISVDDSFSGRLEFLRYLIQNFRLKVFQTILQVVSENREYMKREAFRQQLVLPLSQAIYRHLREYPEPFLEDLALDAFEFGARGSAERQQFYEALNSVSELQRHRVPRGRELQVGQVPRVNALASIGLGTRTIQHSRQHALSQTIEDFRSLTQKILFRSLNIKKLEDMKDSEAWLQVPFDEFFPSQEFGEDISDLLSRYLQRIFDPAIERSSERSMTSYEAMRLLSMAIDQAISRLSWAKLSYYVSKGLVFASQDTSLGQSPHVQDLLFRNAHSIFNPLDDELVFALARSMPHFELAKSMEVDQHNKFEAHCSDLLKQIPNQ